MLCLKFLCWEAGILENHVDPRKTCSFSKLYIFFKKNFTFKLDYKVMHEVGKWVAVKFNKQWNPGGVVDTYNNKIDIKCMRIIG